MISARKDPVDMKVRVALVLAMALAALHTAAPPSLAADGEMPIGWQKTGSHPGEYDMGLDASVRHDGRASGFIRSNTADVHGYGALGQVADASPYRGKRLRLSGQLKTLKMLTGSGALWLRVDGPPHYGERHGQVLAMDNMAQRPVKGTTNWTHYEIVLDVPPEAVTLHYGALVDGEGQLWVDSLTLETVSLEVPLTGTPLPARTPAARRSPPAPQNLDFDKLRDPIGILRTIMSAQAYYKTSNPADGYACDFAALVGARALSDKFSWNEPIDGYVFAIECVKAEKPQTAFRASAAPATGKVGATYCTNGTDLLKSDGDATLCFAKGIPLGK
jgi:hypothetical protein